MGVYPRVCGGITASVHLFPAVQGLSPRVRGHPCPARPALSEARSIPACAGASRAGPHLVGSGGVYPRVCGGITAHLRAGHRRGGLSPRVRGHRPLQLDVAERLRSIPACAGASTHALPGCSASGVYPRVCGGIIDRLKVRYRVGGLSPRVRGHRKETTKSLTKQRSIPACAGASP